MGAVYRALDRELGRDVALKFVNTELSRVLREARMTARPKHRHIVEVYDYGSGPPPFLVMEWLEGRDLSQVLAFEGALAWPRAARLMLQASQAVAAAHEHTVVHGDLKPANLFVEGSGADEYVKLLDFGIAEWLLPEAGSDPSKRRGTQGYIAPELLSRSWVGGPNPVSDVYALGVILLELITGDRPASHQPVTALPGVPRALRELLAQALAPSPQSRLASAGQFAERLALCLRDARARTNEGAPTTAENVATGSWVELARADRIATPVPAQAFAGTVREPSATQVPTPNHAVVVSTERAPSKDGVRREVFKRRVFGGTLFAVIGVGVAAVLASWIAPRRAAVSAPPPASGTPAVPLPVSAPTSVRGPSGVSDSARVTAAASVDRVPVQALANSAGAVRLHATRGVVSGSAVSPRALPSIPTLRSTAAGVVSPQRPLPSAGAPNGPNPFGGRL
jgi:serine/threonine-protein kinase